ncbi:MAG: excinuclease ABC subunit UvrC [Chloroflexi bacterium]|nr:excinuclease ABC subunit UvrC [Chloroflexota bacterium]MBU1749364.1 excinuclease ABC subunit UvrC [Chloroflexota bacterium]
MIESELLQERLRALPESPGVYIMRDEAGQVIYVGKAVRLRDRVRSYFTASAGHSFKTQELVSHIADLETIVTASELEALLLENTLIKQHRPRYNIRLKDDKTYPYIKVTVQETWPRVLVTRRLLDDGARYFGPFSSAKSVRRTVELLDKLFPYRSCNKEIDGQARRSCLYYHIGRCLGPCIGVADQAAYQEAVRGVTLFLEGKQEELVAGLHTQMETAAESWEFERAARLRDQIRAVENVIQRQRVVSNALSDHDVIALARDPAQPGQSGGETCAQVFFVRGGKLLGRENFVLTGTEGKDQREIMTSFVEQFYAQATHVPREVVLQSEVDEAAIIAAWLRQKRGARVVIKVPRRGEKRALVELVAQNAAQALTEMRARWLTDQHKTAAAIAELQEALELDRPPMRIEGYDISNIQGQSAVGSMVVFQEGAPRSKDYRRFRIKTVAGADDYAMLQEVLRRRFKRAHRDAAARDAAARDAEADDSAWARLPDLILIDGGKGQLNAALAVLDEAQLEIPTLGLAKQREEVFVRGVSEPINLPPDSQGLYLLQRIRDEAHRFAITYHRRVRQTEGVRSRLDDVPGVGPRRKAALLKHFGSVPAIQQATVTEIAAVPGIHLALAEQIKEALGG